MRISRALHNEEHSIRLTVTSQARGWEVEQQEDAQTVSDVVHTDSHRVERALRAFDHRVGVLRKRGWVDSGDSDRHSRDAA